MSQPKTTKAYPRFFLELIETIGKDPTERLELKFDKLSEAHTFRLQFHSFRAAAINEGMQEMWPEISAVFVQVIKEPPSVVIQHKDHTDTMNKLRSQLNTSRKIEGKEPLQEPTYKGLNHVGKDQEI